MFCVSAFLQQVAPAPQSFLPGVHCKYEMQMPSPCASRSLSHESPEGHSPPPAVQGLPIPRQLPAVVGQLVPCGG